MRTLLVLLASPVFLQAQDASLSGLIKDQSDAVIVKAGVTATHTETGVKRTTESNDAGLYAFPALKPGRYLVVVQKAGFQTVSREDVTLTAAQNAAVDFVLRVGDTAQTVIVSGDATLANTTDASVSTVIDRQFAENLSLNGRSFQSLIYLTPGVALNMGAGAGSGSAWTTGQFSVNGQRTASNYWTVDGVSANIGVASWNGTGNGAAGGLGAFNVLGGTNSLVSVDALQEFRIQTSTYAPEFGRTPGGQISIVTRSGTNQFHGALFDYFRNTVLDANDWFNSTNALPKAAERQNDFGGVLGGPVLKDKTFFFFSYEGLRLTLPRSFEGTVPDLAARQNAIPAVRPFLNAFPLPNGPEVPSVAGAAQFNATFSIPASINAYSVRIDHAVTKSVNLFGRYNQSPSNIATRGAFGATANTIQTVTSRTNTATVGATWTKSSKIANEVRFNYSIAGGHVDVHMDTFGGGAVGPGASLLPSPYTLQDAAFTLGTFFGTNMWWGEGLNSRNTQHQYNAVDTLSVQEGSHGLKFGVDYRRLSPSLSPDASYTLIPLFTDIPSLEAGKPDGTYVSHATPPTFLFNNLGLFAQDTWRVSPRVTLTYGLRWDIDFRATTENGPSIPAVTGFSLTDLSKLALAPPGGPPYSTRYGGLAPRIGAAYQISPRPEWGLVLRGGIGVFYDLAGTELGNADLFSYPFDIQVAAPNISFPPTPSEVPPPAVVPPDATQGRLAAFDPHLNLPYTLQWSVALEQALGNAQTLTASYVGAVGRRLLATESITAPNPNYADALLIGNAGSSNYNALQVQLQRRLSRGLQAVTSYTWSHAIDTGSSGSYNDGSFVNINANRSSSDFDIRHSFSGALTYNIPAVQGNAFAKAILGGWSTENIVQIHSAPPLNVIDGAFTALSIESGASVVVRPDVVPGQPLYLYGSQYPGEKALNSNAFTNPPSVVINGVPTPTRQGDLGRNAVRGFGLTQWDFAVHRDVPIREGLKLQFRAEMFNLLNHPNFGPNNNTFGKGDPNFGRSTQLLNQYTGSSGGASTDGGLSSQYALGGPRSIQLALKLVF